MIATSDADYTGIDSLEVMREAVNYNRYLIDLVAGRAQPGDVIVDFGAGCGTFAVPMHNRGHIVVCVEPDLRLRRSLTGFGLTVHQTLDELPDRSVDYLYSLNVLEHIEDDRAAAAAWFAKLKPGGRLLVYVPAFQMLFTSMDRKVGHFRRYRREPLARLLVEAGFAIDRARYADALGFPATLLYRLIGNANGEIDRGAVKLYDRAVFPVSRLLDGVLSGLIGKNLLVLAHRPQNGSGRG